MQCALHVKNKLLRKVYIVPAAENRIQGAPVHDFPPPSHSSTLPLISPKPQLPKTGGARHHLLDWIERIFTSPNKRHPPEGLQARSLLACFQQIYCILNLKSERNPDEEGEKEREKEVVNGAGGEICFQLSKCTRLVWRRCGVAG